MMRLAATALVLATIAGATAANHADLERDLHLAREEVARIEALLSKNGAGVTGVKRVASRDWAATRTQLISTLFGTNGTLPSRSVPDYIEEIPGPQAHGCYCAYFGNCNASDCAYGNNMTMLKWEIEAKVNASYTLRLNSTVFHTLNTSGVAPQIWPPVGPPSLPGGGWYGKQPSTSPAAYAQARQKTLVVFHHGHSVPCDQCWVPWLDNAMDWLNELGMDAMILQMPLHQCNYVAESGCNHEWFAQFEKQGVHTMRYFLEPAVLSINYAIEHLGYEQIVFMGLSGGGWTTTLMGAIDTRIQLSIPIAGSIPCEFKHTSWDYEQFCSNEWAQVCDYECLYTLAALEPNRYQVQVLHEQDPCCYAGHGRHSRIKAYNAKIQAEVAGHFETLITVGNVHQVDPRNKVVAGMLIDNLRVHGTLSAGDFAALPFNTLDQWGP